MKNIKKLKDQKKTKLSKDGLIREELKKAGAKETVRCPEMFMGE